MKNLFQKTLLFFVLISFLVNFALAGVKEGEVVEHLLPNGLKVLTVEMHNAPIIFSQLSYKVDRKSVV